MMVFFKYPEAFFLLMPIVVYVIYIASKNFIKFKTKKELEEYHLRNRRARIFLMISRLIIYSLLIFALASPVNIEDKEISGDLSLILFTDNSTSFELFDSNAVTELKAELEKQIPTSVKTIASGSKSAIGDGIINNIGKNENILVISDGNNNHGRDLADIIVLANNLNATINMLNLAPLKSDSVVYIEGPSEEIIGSDLILKVKVDQVGKAQNYNLKVDIDGNLLFDQDGIGINEYPISQKLGEGYHKITARLTIEDHFSQNNVYYKSVNILPKPKVLLVSKSQSILQTALSSLYDITQKTEIPTDLKGYSAIILNDYPISDIGNVQMDSLINFVTDGRGLFVIGGQNSYDYGSYKDSRFETLLPVKSGTGDSQDSKEVSVVLVLDISESSGGMFVKGERVIKADVMKGLALSVLDSVKKDDKIGVVAFNTQGYLISPLTPLNSKPEVRESIQKLRPTGGTDITQGLFMADQLLRNVKGSRNIILISDGITIDPMSTLRQAGVSNIAGIKTYSVGVGFDTFEFLMQEIARYGKGIYFQPTQAERLKILFGDPEDTKEQKDDLIILNNNHFITRDMVLDGKVGGYNQVVPKSSAEMLVTTGQGKPIITVWRFGLGRVVSLSTDDGKEWAGDLVSTRNSKLLSKAINWAVGNPTLEEDFRVDSEDTFLGESTEITVKSSQRPVSKEISFAKEDENLYRGVFTPNAPGFYDVVGTTIAVNYEREYLKLGMNPQLRDLVAITQGEIFNAEDTQKIIDKVKSNSKRTESRNVSYRWPFIITALILFVIEIFIRRIRENSKTHREK